MDLFEGVAIACVAVSIMGVILLASGADPHTIMFGIGAGGAVLYAIAPSEM